MREVLSLPAPEWCPARRWILGLELFGAVQLAESEVREGRQRTVPASATAGAEVFSKPSGNFQQLATLEHVAEASAAQNTFTCFGVTSFLQPGANVISVRGPNGPMTFPGCASPCTYMENPAGVVFGG